MDWMTVADGQSCAHRAPEDERFFLELSDSDEHGREIAAALKKNGVGPWRPGYNYGAFAAEWGYGYTHLRGQKDGMGREIGGAEDPPPADRPAALNEAQEFLQRFYIHGAPRPWVAMNGHYPWHHYSGRFGYDRLGSEVGENINNIQWHIALNRGAAVQYKKPWFIDFSSWFGPGVLDYFDPPHWIGYSGADNGHSLSLVRRTFFMSYMAGADEVIAESGGMIAVLPERDGDGDLRISPYGELCRAFSRFVEQFPDVGNAYIPLALVLDEYHGAYPGFEGKKSFGRFAYTAGDEMLWQIVDIFFPGGWEVQGRREEGCLINTRYGDGIDVLLQDAPQDVLDRYPVLLPAGDIAWRTEEVERLLAYVRCGGTLLLNAAWADTFGLGEKAPDTYPIGNGRICLYGSKAFAVDGLTALLDGLWAEKMPLRFSVPVEYTIGASADQVWLMLINNDGVTKDYHTPVQIDENARRETEVTYRGAMPDSITDILSGESVPVADGRFRTVLEPGQIRIYSWAREEN